MEHQFEESIARIFGQRARDLLRLGRNGLEIGRHLLGLPIVREAEGGGLQEFRLAPAIEPGVLGNDIGDLRCVGWSEFPFRPQARELRDVSRCYRCGSRAISRKNSMGNSMGLRSPT